MRIIETKDVSAIRPLYDAWLAIANGDEFGLDIDLTIADENAQKIIDAGGVLLVAYDNNDLPIGFFAVSPMQSAFGNQMIATETAWFALPNNGFVGLDLIDAAKKWAVKNGCSHLMLAASGLASDLHDKICRYCEIIGAKKFETIYLLELE